MRIPFPFLALSMLFFSVAFNISEARMPEPASMPYSLRGGEPHKMTKEEAERTEVYMIFRNARRMQDLKDVKGLSKEDRRAVMAHKREIRGNPLIEYANYCGLTLERAKELMNLMHGSDKGTKYYQKV